MNAIERLNGLKTWAAGNLEYENAANITHDLNAVIEAVIRLNKKADLHDNLAGALEKIDSMSFKTGRADLLGLRIREIIRQSFEPDKPCPHCKGTGLVPSTDHECGVCKKRSDCSWGTTKCGLDNKWRDESDWGCGKFEDFLPMRWCEHCNSDGKKI